MADAAAIPDWAQGKFVPADQIEAAPQPAAQAPVPATQPTSGVPDWAQGKFVPADQVDGSSQFNSPTALQSTPPAKTYKNNSALQNVGRIADIARSAATEGAAAGNPLGMAFNAPSFGLTVGAKVLGQPIATGINMAYGQPLSEAWKNAGNTSNDVAGTISKYVPTTNDLVKYGSKIMGLPIAEPGKVSGLTGAQPLPGEQAANSVIQMIAGAPGLGQSAKLGAAIGASNAAISESPIGDTYAALPLQVAAGIGMGYAGNKMSPEKTAIADPLKTGKTFNATDAQMQTASQDLSNRASDSDQIISNLQAVQNKGELVPGSTPTMGEVAGDIGIANAQKGMQTLYKDPFAQQEQERQTALAAPLAALQANGNVENLGAYARATIEAQQEGQDQAVEGLKQSSQSAITVAQNHAKSAMQELGHYGDQPETGATGDVVLDAHAVQDQRANDMYKVLDKVNAEPADLVTLRNAASKINQQGQEYGNAPPGSTVSAVIGRILSQPEGAQDTVQTLRNFQSQISKAQRSLAPDERGDMSLLTQLKTAANQGLENTVNGLALRSTDFYSDMQKHIDETKDQLYGEKQQTASRNVPPTGLSGSEQKPNPILPGDAGSKGQTAGQPGTAAGNKGIQSPLNKYSGQLSEESNLTPKDLAAIKAANGYYLQKSTLQEFAGSGIIDSTGALVADKFAKWYANPNNRKMLQRNPGFSEQLNAASSAQQSVEQAQQNAQSSLDAAQKMFAAQNKEVGKTAFAKYANEAADPVGVTSRIFGLGAVAARKQFYQLVDKVSGNPEALQSLKDQTSQHLYNLAKVSENKEGAATGLGRPDAFKNFVKLHQDSLNKIYGDDGTHDALQAIANDIQRRQDYAKMTTGAPGSDTAANLAYSQRYLKNTVLGAIIDKVIKPGVVGAGAHLGGPLGAVAAEYAGQGLSKLNNALNRSGLETVDKIQLAMMRDPTGFGLDMLQKYQGKQPTNSMLNKAAVSAMKLNTIPMEKSQ